MPTNHPAAAPWPRRRSARALPGATLPLLVAAIALAIAACSGAGAGPSPTPGSSQGVAESPRPTPTSVPGGSEPGSTDGAGGSGGSGPGAGGGSAGNVGSGILPPGIAFPLPPGPDESLLGQAKYLDPVVDLINQHPVNVQLVRAALVDGKAFADLRWYSGVAPCNQLDSVRIARDDAAMTIHLTVIEGSGRGEQMCIEIAELHAVAVDLGSLASGSWTISAEGDAPAVTLDVP